MEEEDEEEGSQGESKFCWRVAARFIETLHVATGEGWGGGGACVLSGSSLGAAACSACWRHISTPDSRRPHCTLLRAAHVSSFHNLVLSEPQRSWGLAALLFFTKSPFCLHPKSCNFQFWARLVTGQRRTLPQNRAAPRRRVVGGGSGMEALILPTASARALSPSLVIINWRRWMQTLPL